MNAVRRICLWFGSLLVSVTLFTLLLNLFFSRSGAFSAAMAFLIFRVTMTFALPVWCLYLPWVIALKDTEERRIRTILFSGTLIGPVSMAIWDLLLQLRGGDPQTIWHGDPLIGIGGFATIIFAFIVGFLTTSLYVIALKVLHRQSVPA
jgi:hypothetical protein